LILEACGIARYFLEVGGPDSETPAKPDPAMLRRLMATAGAEPAETVVVGDTEVDFEFGRAAGCRVVLVPGGSRSLEELKMMRADALLSRFGELPGWLAGNLPSGALQSGS
jgi:phosphoglycolate phosphatase